jgi:hypothetical protein
MSVFLASLAFWRDPTPAAPLFAEAGAFLALSAWFRDISAVRAAFVFVLLLAVGLLLAFAAAGGRSPAWAAYALAGGGAALLVGLTGHPVVAVALVGLLTWLGLVLRDRARLAAVAVGVALAATAFALVEADELALSEQPTTLTTDDYELWRAVRRVVPPDGLVFTSMTGKAVDGRQGWNNYPGIAGRQLYLAGWYDGRLTSRPEELDRRLLLNNRVLTGRAAPSGIALTRRFSSYFAVVPRGTSVPPTFRKVWANRSFVLYRVPAP